MKISEQRAGEYRIKVDGFSVDTLCHASLAARQCASFVRQFGPARVTMLDHEGRVMSLTAALQGKLEIVCPDPS